MVHKTIAEAKKNLEEAIPYIGPRYKTSVLKADWATNAGGDQAEANYADGVSKAVAGKTRQKAIRLVSNADWQNSAANLGAPIIGERVRAGLTKYESNMGPVLDAMNLAADAAPPKGPDFRANVTNRLIPVIEAAKTASGRM